MEVVGSALAHDRALVLPEQAGEVLGLGDERAHAELRLQRPPVGLETGGLPHARGVGVGGKEGLDLGPDRNVTGGLAAVSGMLMSARIASGSPTLAQGLELDVIAAVIIGGTSFSGGVGTVRGTLIGILFIGVISNGMTLLNMDPFYQYIVRGGLILAAVLANRLQEVKK